MAQNQTFICGLGCFHRHRRLSLDYLPASKQLKVKPRNFFLAQSAIGRSPADRVHYIDFVPVLALS